MQDARSFLVGANNVQLSHVTAEHLIRLRKVRFRHTQAQFLSHTNRETECFRRR